MKDKLLYARSEKSRTGILLLVFYEKIKVATDNQDTLLEQQEQDIDSLVINLISQDIDLDVESQLNIYLNLNSSHIITEKKLEDSKIIEIVLDEENQLENEDSNNSDKEEPEITVLEELMRLKKFINFFEQQTNTNFKAEDLKIF
ncbi:18667_t:CDS:2 [Dentiscutata erythropus]|uniref:18667_t:CDS:1 n=1 Tax=Dentiscutata erythropus TaxID=1348616 RepID=A0A9N8ZMS4_9GLOM|nr:18667_t:CDS:2 [Dentiscutata erythropus]